MVGPEGKHAYTIEALLEIVRTQQFDMIVMEQVPGMQSWCGPGEHLKDGTDGPVFKALRREFEKNGYHFQWIKIQIAHLHIPQFRERLAIVATHERVTKAVGTMNLQLPEKQQHSQIGPFLLSNPRFYSKVAPISELQPDPGQRHQDYKPHKIGYYGDAEVWGEKGLSPCIRTANEVLVGLGDWIVKIEVQGMAALQGIPITDLPPDVHEARRQIGNAIHRDMGTFVLTQVVQHIHQYKRHIGVETPMSNDAEISTDTEAQALQYRQHLDRLLGQAQQAKVTAKANKTHSSNSVKIKKRAGWTCYHSDDPRANCQALHSTARATEFCPDAGLTEGKEANSAEGAREPLKTEVETLGEQWKAQFRAAASAQGECQRNVYENWTK